MEIILFLLGGRLYTWIEMLWRNCTHWTMFLLGGLCFVIIGLRNEHKFCWETPLLRQCVEGSCVITVLEFITGIIVNVLLGWHVWDYSGMPLNIMGQVCLPYFLLWIPMSALCIIADDWIRYGFYLALRKYIPGIQERIKPHYIWRIKHAA